MTTDNRDEPDLRTPEENNSDKIKEGFADPAGEYPKKSYFFEPSINKAARSVERNELSIGGGFDGLSVDLPQQQESRYPYNRVMETASGHVIEFDDTPGGERILIKHNSGSGLELRSDGSTVMKTESNSVTSVAGSSAIIVEGDADIKVNGNMSLSVAGDLNLDVGGNINTNVGGDKKETISGASRETVYGSKGSIVRENNSQTVLGNQTSTVLGTNSNIVKGDNRLSVQGSSIFGVKGSFKQTSEGELVVSSPNINIGAENLSVFGASGTIGGAGIIHYGVTYYGTTFHGDLKGTAEFAELADETNYQNYPANEVGTQVGYTITNDTTASASANSTTMDAYLNQSVNGTMKVQIDEGDFLKNIIDRSEENDGVSEKPLDTRGIRSVLRDNRNLSSTKLTGNAVSRGVLSSTYTNTVPKGIDRISNNRSSTRLPFEGVTSPINRIGRFKNDKNTNVGTFIPDPKYNPNNIAENVPITGNIELSKGVKLSKFLGGTGEKVTLSHLDTREKRLQIARQYILQAEAIKTVLENKGQFKDHRLVVVEGLYKAGPSETITSGSLNDTASKGQTVVYELHDKTGKIDAEATYDLAEWWKDILNFDKLSLSYDTFDPSGEMTAQIILTMPVVDSNYNLVNGRYGNQIETLYNMNVQGQELIEITEV